MASKKKGLFMKDGGGKEGTVGSGGGMGGVTPHSQNSKHALILFLSVYCRQNSLIQVSFSPLVSNQENEQWGVERPTPFPV